MTVVVACKFSSGSVLIADSRISLDKTNIRSDTAQKAFVIGRNMLLAYTGDVNLVSLIMNTLGQSWEKNSKNRHFRKIIRDLPRISRFHMKNYCAKLKISNPNYIPSVQILLLRADKEGHASFLVFDSMDNFDLLSVQDDVLVLGSGHIIKQQLENKYQEIKSYRKELKENADMLFTWLGVELGKYNKDIKNSVGGLLQIYLVGKNYISPLTYKIVDINPEGNTGLAKEIKYSNKKWTQTDLISGKRAENKYPFEIANSYILDKRVHEYKNDKTNVRSCFLSYFLLARSLNQTASRLEFKGLINCVGLQYYPGIFMLRAYASFTGTGGEYELKIQLDNTVEIKDLRSEILKIKHLFEPVDLDFTLYAPLSRPGIHFVNCVIDSAIVARYPFYAGEAIIATPDQPTSEKGYQVLGKSNAIGKMWLKQYDMSTDDLLSSRNAFVNYFFICKSAQRQENSLVIESEWMAAYSKSFSYKMLCDVSAGMRLKKGKHTIRIDLQDAIKQNRKICTINEFPLESPSDSRQIHCKVANIIEFPQPGLYFINLYIDEKLEGSILFPADNDDPEFSFGLRPEERRLIDSGVPLCLLKRAQPIKII